MLVGDTAIKPMTSSASRTSGCGETLRFRSTQAVRAPSYGCVRSVVPQLVPHLTARSSLQGCLVGR